MGIMESLIQLLRRKGPGLDSFGEWFGFIESQGESFSRFQSDSVPAIETADEVHAAAEIFEKLMKIRTNSNAINC